MDEMLISQIDFLSLFFCFFPFFLGLLYGGGAVTSSLVLQGIVDGGFQFGSGPNQDRF